MSPLRYGCACVGVAALGAAITTTATAGAGEAAAEEPPKLTGSMQCERAAEPGRVKCSVEAKVLGDRSIAWADVALVELPEFTAALKGRIGPTDAVFRDAASQKWAFGLISRKAGNGEARARVRAMVCERGVADAGATKCAATTIDVRAVVHVG